MLDDRFERDRVAPPPDPRRYPTGLLTLIGTAAGLVAGLWLDSVPLGTAAGLAAGVGIDSLLNNWFNGENAV